MALLNDREAILCISENSRRISHYFNSFFVERLLNTDREYRYSNVKRWSKKFDIFELDKIFFPINTSNTHWSSVVVFPQREEIYYLDSLYGLGLRYMEGLLEWVVDEAKEKKGETLDRTRWKLITARNISKQGNDNDCGTFTIEYADFLSDNLPLDEHSFTQMDMPFFREKIAADILRGRLLY